MAAVKKKNKMDSLQKPRIRRKRLGEQLTVQLRKHIIDKGLKPGDALLTEQEMVVRFGVSRSVVREATKTLDFLGIISAVPRRGMVLDDFDFERVAEYFGFHFALCDYPREKLLKARMVIETGALFYTMEEMKKNPSLYFQLQRLAESAPKTRNAADQRWIDYDIAFHRGLVEASDITPLASFCDLLQMFFQKFRPSLRGVSGSVEHHCEIVEALHAGDLDTAMKLLRRHVAGYPADEGVLHDQSTT
jgi:GntR family transcriptional regulator, transcriptional repressor for pyruvate dehydrogenase complex